MRTFDLIDKCDELLGSIYANASTIKPDELQEAVEEINQLLTKIRKCILAEFDYNRSNQF